VREEKMTIPTWEIGPPEVHSLFPNPKGPIYPYTLNETLTDRKVDKVYSAVVLENEYVKVLVLPEIGGGSTVRRTRPTNMSGSIGSARSSRA